MSNVSSASLETLLSRFLQVPVDEIHDDVGQDNLMAWTSLVHIQIINAVEETFHVALTTKEIAQAKTVRQLRAILLSRGVQA